nr:translation initiation factor IF-2-like isoform X2 [Taeniopygia guttata]
MLRRMLRRMRRSGHLVHRCPEGVGQGGLGGHSPPCKVTRGAVLPLARPEGGSAPRRSARQHPRGGGGGGDRARGCSAPAEKGLRRLHRLGGTVGSGGGGGKGGGREGERGRRRERGRRTSPARQRGQLSFCSAAGTASHPSVCNPRPGSDFFRAFYFLKENKNHLSDSTGLMWRGFRGASGLAEMLPMDIRGKGITPGINVAPDQTVGCWHQPTPGWEMVSTGTLRAVASS